MPQHAASASQRAAEIADVSQRVQVDVTGVGPRFAVRTEIEFSARTPGSSTYLDLRSDGLESAVFNSRPLDLATTYDGRRLALHGLEASNRVVVESRPSFDAAAGGIARFVDPVESAVYFTAQFGPDGAPAVFACFDDPAIPVTWTFDLAVPPGVEVAGTAPGGAQDGHAVVVPPLALPVSRLALTMGSYARQPFATAGSVPVTLLCRPQVARFIDIEALCDIVSAGFARLEALAPFPFPDLTIVFAPGLNEATASGAGTVVLGEGLLSRLAGAAARRTRLHVTALRELAWQWFGAWVGPSTWSDAWIADGVATYLAFEMAQEWPTFLMVDRAGAVPWDRPGLAPPVVDPTRDATAYRLYRDPIVRTKGAAMVRQLAAIVGVESLTRGLRTYLARQDGRPGNTAGLLAAMDDAASGGVSGRMMPWLTTVGLSSLGSRVVEAPGPDGAARVDRVTVHQRPADDGQLRPHRVRLRAFGLEGKADTVSEPVWTDIVDAATEVPFLRGEPAPLSVIVNDDGATWARWHLDTASDDRVAPPLEHTRDPVTRAAIWAGGWDAVRDGSLPCTTFIDRMMQYLFFETHPATMAALIARASFGIEHCLASASRPAAHAVICDHFRLLAGAAVPGGEAQQQLLLAAIEHAWTGDQLDWLDDMARGRERAVDLEPTATMRWALLETLALHGRRSAGDIERALLDDLTASGHRAAQACRAAIPTVEAKRATWDLLLSRPSLPLGTMQEALRGFARVRDRSLLAEFVVPYFDILPSVFDDRQFEAGAALVAGLYPSLVADGSSTPVEELTEACLDSLPPGPVQQLVAMQLAELLRDQAAQAIDARGPRAMSGDGLPAPTRWPLVPR